MSSAPSSVSVSYACLGCERGGLGRPLWPAGGADSWSHTLKTKFVDWRFRPHGLQLSAHNAFPLSKPSIFKWEDQGDNQEYFLL